MIVIESNGDLRAPEGSFAAQIVAQHVGVVTGRAVGLGLSGIASGRPAAARTAAGPRHDAIAAWMAANHGRGMDATSKCYS